jgi:hypothetical protein
LPPELWSAPRSATGTMLEKSARVAASLHDLEQIRAANNYDMHGHGLRAERHLELAMRELDLAVRSAGR